jgi:preprotein translocase subunit SecY
VRITEGYQNMFRIPELKRRLLFTAMILIIYRLGGHIPTPGVDTTALRSFFDGQQGTLLGLYDLFAGGNLSKATIFALGIMPYISASIILQLMQAVVPALEKLAKEGEEGRAKITQYTRYGTVLLATIQAAGISIALEQFTGGAGEPVVPNPGMLFKFVTVVTLVSGTMFVMWLGEQITERGIGNGISLIITIGIIARYPRDFLQTVQQMRIGELTWIKLIPLLAFMAVVIAAIILITQGQRRIPVQYAKKMVGRRMYGGASTHIPLKVNTAGVIPIIFAQSIIMFPSTLAQYFPDSAAMQSLASIFSPGQPVYIGVYSVIIIFFSYFYTAVVLNPVDLADNMKKHGGFIPGIRPGKRTAEFIDRVLSRVTLPGSIFLAVIAVLPDILIRQFNVPFYFGGTGLLIVVGVTLDTLQQIESHLMMRNYDGFMKRGKLRGRR